MNLLLPQWDLLDEQLEVVEGEAWELDGPAPLDSSGAAEHRLPCRPVFIFQIRNPREINRVPRQDGHLS